MATEQQSKNRYGTIFHQPSQRLMFTGLVVTIVVVLAISFTLASLDNYRQHSKLAEEDVQIKAGLLAAVHEQWLAEMENLMKAMASVLELQSVSSQSCQRLLTEYINISPGIDSVMLLDKSGELICSTPPATYTANFSAQQYFKQAIVEKQFVVGHYQQSLISKQRILPLAMPVLELHSGEVKLVLVMGRSLDWVEFTLSRQYQLADMEVSIVNREGTVLVRGSDSHVKPEAPYPSLRLRQALSKGDRKSVV